MMNVTQEICKGFSKQASVYEKNAKAQNEIGRRLFERLDYLKMQPRFVLDLGCGAGQFTDLLKKRYPQAQIVGLDLSEAMLLESKKKQHQDNNWHLVAGAMQNLPFDSQVFDLVFANQVIHWAPSLPLVFNELNRIMCNEGCLMFTTLGPDTFIELKQTWQQVHAFRHTNDFIDMHDIVDMLVASCLLDPVIDREVLTLQYPDLQTLLKSLQSQGVRNIHTKRNQGLTGKNAWALFEAAYKKLITTEAKYPLTYEVIYGQAWKGQKGVNETYIPVSILKT